MVSVRVVNSLQAGSPLRHTHERQTAKQSSRKESDEEAPRKHLAASLSYLAALPLNFVLAALPHLLVLQREPARRLGCKVNRKLACVAGVCYTG